jgi:hypothetical protein
MAKYIKYKLSPGQQAPPGSTGATISGTDYIVWVGEEEKYFNCCASHGTILEGDIIPAKLYVFEDMTEEEIIVFQNKMMEVANLDYSKISFITGIEPNILYVDLQG